MKTANKEERAAKRKFREEERRQKMASEASSSSQTVELASSSSAEASQSESTDDEEIKACKDDRPPKKAKQTVKNVISPDVCAALDRSKLTDRMATYVLTETAKSLGHNPNELNITRSSIKRHREQHRRSFMKSEFEKVPSIVHWDGKLIQDLLNSDKQVDRLAVVVSTTNGQCQLLGAPKLPTGKGQEQANAVAQLLQEWEMTECVIGMYFDTTVSNTGRLSGACVCLERHLKRNLFYFACRHHIMEVMMTGTFTACYGLTSGPYIALFKRFKAKWNDIDKSNYDTCLENEELLQVIGKDERDNVLQFARKALDTGKYRDDYREFIELSILFLGEKIPGYHFKRPGAIHHARWMAKVLYCLKMWMFQKQLEKLTPREKTCLKDVSVFAVTIYLKAWVTAPIAAAAPFSDLQLLQKLRQYHNKKIAKAAASKFEGHLWYLSEEMVGLALFDSSVSVETKRLILKGMEEREGSQECPKRVSLPQDPLPTLDSLTSTNCLKLLQGLKINSAFLHKDPSTWDSDEGFQEALQKVENIKVVNDNAERGVALIQGYSGKHTRNEEQLQYLLHVVEQHRKKYPEPTKRTLNSGLQ